jgi:hypothetical protein
VERVWRKLRIPTLILSIAFLFVAIASFILGLDEFGELQSRAVRAAKDANSMAYAQRLREDGERLAREGAYEDALARYDQARRFDHAGDLRGETKKKLDAIKGDLGEVVLDKSFQASPSSP